MKVFNEKEKDTGAEKCHDIWYLILDLLLNVECKFKFKVKVQLKILTFKFQVQNRIN